MVLDVDILMIALLSVAWLILLWRFFARRTPLRFAAVLAGAIGVVGVARAIAPELVDFCSQTQPHIDCVPDQFDRAAWITLNYLEHPWGRMFWIGIVGTVLLTGIGGMVFIARTRRHKQPPR